MTAVGAKRILSEKGCDNFTAAVYWDLSFFLLPAQFMNCYLSCCCFQGVMEEQDVLTGDSSFNAHFGECITAIGDIDDDGYQGQFQSKLCPHLDLRQLLD